MDSVVNLSYLNNIQPSVYSNFSISVLLTKLIEILPEEEITEDNYPENYDQIIEILTKIRELVISNEEEISIEFLNKVDELKSIANLRQFNKDLYFTLGMALTRAIDSKAADFNADLINTYSREELAMMYRKIMRARDDSIRNAPTEFVANVNTFHNPATKKLEIIDRRVKVLDATNSLVERHIPHLEEMIASGQIKRISQDVLDVRTMLSILREDLNSELRTRLTNILTSLKGLEECEDSVVTLENALNGIYETPLPEDFHEDKADEA